MTHTLGPWHFYAETNSVDPNWHHVANESRMRILANVHIEPGNQMDLANARLMAASPSLLEALEYLLDDVDCHCDGDDRSMTLDITAGRARAAIAKARGQS